VLVDVVNTTSVLSYAVDWVVRFEPSENLDVSEIFVSDRTKSLGRGSSLDDILTGI
jgi:hypothetical protein